MKVCIFGSTGEAGSRLVSEAIKNGHDVIAPVRNPEKAQAMLPGGVSISSVDFTSINALTDAIADADCVINAAGYVADGADYVALVNRIIAASDTALGAGGRFWLFGGAAVLNVPQRDFLGLDLPGVPALFEPHRANFEAVRESRLDWSMMCPGPMVSGKADLIRDDLIISRNVWPVSPPSVTRFLPRLALSLSFRKMMPRLMVSYEDVARLMIAHLAPGGPYSCARVGVALPAAEKPERTNKSKWEAAS